MSRAGGAQPRVPPAPEATSLVSWTLRGLGCQAGATDPATCPEKSLCAICAPRDWSSVSVAGKLQGLGRIGSQARDVGGLWEETDHRSEGLLQWTQARKLPNAGSLGECVPYPSKWAFSTWPDTSKVLPCTSCSQHKNRTRTMLGSNVCVCVCWAEGG